MKQLINFGNRIRKLRERRGQTLAESIAGEGRIKALHGAQFPYEDVRDFFYRRNNHMEALDHAAEPLFEEKGFQIDENRRSVFPYPFEGSEGG